MRLEMRLLTAPLLLALACGDDGPPTSGGSGDGSSGAPDSSSSDIGTTSLATTSGSSSDGGTTSGTSSSTGPLDDSTTGAPEVPCDACAETDICVLDFTEKNCLFCEDVGPFPLNVICVPRTPATCDESLTHTLACSLALCGTPYADSEGCGCNVSGDFVCGVNPFVPPACDYWGDLDKICGPGFKCLPARDEQQQPLPYTECIPPADEPLPVGSPCMVDFGEDACEAGAYCDEVDPDTLMGVCRTLCTGTVDMPSCEEPGESCVLFAEGQPEFGGVCRAA